MNIPARSRYEINNDLGNLLEKTRRNNRRFEEMGEGSAMSLDPGSDDPPPPYTRPTHTDDLSINRSFAEAEERTQELASQFQHQNFNYGITDNESYVKLLSQKTFDAQQLTRDIDTSVFDKERPVSSNQYTYDVTDVDGFMTRNVDNLIWGHIHESMGRTPITVLDKIVREVETDWNGKEFEKGQQRFITNLSYNSSRRSNEDAAYNNTTRNFNMGGLDTYTSDLAKDNNNMNYGQNGGNLNRPMNRKTGQSGQSNTSNRPGFVLGHANIVKQIALSRDVNIHRTGMTTEVVGGIRRPAKELGDLLSAVIASSQGPISTIDGLSQKDLEGYQDMIMMISSVVDESRRVPCKPGAFSAICFEPNIKATSSASMSNASSNVSADRRNLLLHARGVRRKKLILTTGCKAHLENQMRDLWFDFVDSAVQSGRMTVYASKAGESSRQKTRSYVCIHNQMGLLRDYSSKVINPVDNDTPVWPFVYHCLRIGDLEGAELELTTCLSAGLHVEECIVVILKLFRRITSALTRFDYADPDTSTHVDPSDLLTSLEKNDLNMALFECRNLYELEVQKPDEVQNFYRLFVLNLLSLTDVDNLNSPTDEIEHYLWGCLWFIQWEGTLKLCGYDTIDDECLDNGEGVLLDKMLVEGGEKYFEYQDTDVEQKTYDENGNPVAGDVFEMEPFSPFMYAKVLVCCQRYGDAIEYLWRKQRTFPAIHLMIICLYYGLILPYRPLTENPSYRGNHAHALSQIYGKVTPATIIRLHISAPFLFTYPQEAFDYLICLNTKWAHGVETCKHCINDDTQFWETEKIKSEACLTHELVHFLVSLQRPQLAKICGDVLNDQVQDHNRDRNSSNIAARTKGYIDEHIRNPADVDKLLSRAAYHILTEVGSSENSIHLYQLAGRYSDAIREIINQLSAVLLPSRPDRDFWRKYALHFFERFIRNGTGPVMISLQQEGALEIVRVFEYLLNLCSFLDFSVNGQYIEALQVIDSMDFLPNTVNDVQRVTDRVKDSDPSLRKATDTVLLHAMECVQRLYLITKNNNGMRNNLAQSREGVNASNDLLQSLKERARALTQYSVNIASLLKHDTSAKLSQVELSMI